MMNGEKLRKRIAYGTLVLACGGIALETTGACSSTPKTCFSPPAVSDAYPGDRTPGVDSNNQGTWRLGILATSLNLPRDAAYQGLIISFRDPTNADADWHTSLPVIKNNNADERIELALGPGDAQFEARIQAAAGSAGSADCQQAPDTIFSTLLPLDQISGTHPQWPS